jgi:signal-transduction protein with cAMP-binding, CBS, and nucleotidyltransferase domain
MEVSRISRKPVVTCAPDTTLQEAAWLMRDEGVGSVVVVDHGSLRGIATDRDVVTRGIAEGLSPEAPIGAVMTTDVAFVSEGDDLCAAATQMATRGCRRLPVVDRLGSVQGVVTLDDLVTVFSEQIGKLAHAVRSELVTAAEWAERDEV